MYFLGRRDVMLSNNDIGYKKAIPATWFKVFFDSPEPKDSKLFDF
jgi:hypothetical protein